MPDYEFYSNTYLGTVIPEKAYPGALQRAQDSLAQIRRSYQVAKTDEVSEKMALCAMAERIYGQSRRQAGVSGATVGSVCVRYQDLSAGRLQRELVDAAGIYLDIYRGATVWNAL